MSGKENFSGRGCRAACDHFLHVSSTYPEYEHQIVARASGTGRLTRWNVECPGGSGLRQDFPADPRAARLRRQRDVFMLPGDQHRSIACQRRRYHLGVVIFAVTGVNAEA